MCVRLLLFLCFISLGGLAEELQKPELQLAMAYERRSVDISEFWVSEKLDGVRGYWNGEMLLTRSGREIKAPKWFVEPLPKNQVLDGELWIGRGKFDEVSGIVRSQVPDEEKWRKVKYCIFDLPKHEGVFDERVLVMRLLEKKIDVRWVKAVEQFRVRDESELHQQLEAVVSKGGEGLMLHRGSAQYQSKRTGDLLKLKPHEDAEGEILSYEGGEGKYAGKVGALVVLLGNGKKIKIGSGLSDADRMNPPAIGELITFQYTGYTSSGLPRFPRFLRVRKSE